jgi:hypothetical protein
MFIVILEADPEGVDLRGTPLDCSRLIIVLVGGEETIIHGPL